MGIESNMEELESIFGSNSTIYARDYATKEYGASIFINESGSIPNIPSSQIQMSFQHNVRK